MGQIYATLGLTDFAFDFGVDPPDVEFRTGNNGWRVWSQKSWTDNTPANLGHTRVNPQVA